MNSPAYRMRTNAGQFNRRFSDIVDLLVFCHLPKR